MMKKEKKTNGVQLLIRCVVRDPDGKVLNDTGQKPSRSFVIQFLEFIHAMAGDIVSYATDVGGGEGFYYNPDKTSSEQFELDAEVNEDDFGIVVGTGDTAETNTDNVLETQLTEGVGVGNITHGAQVVGSAAVVGANVDMEIERAFTNNTGSSITIKEAGVYVSYMDAYDVHCIIRDVLDTPVNVPDKCSLTVIYTVRTTV